MKISMQRSYRSKNGNTTFVYQVDGTKAELEQFKAAQGEYYREDETTGKPLWFTTRFAGNTGKLLITSNGNVVADMSAFDQAASISAQYGGNFGQELARQAAQNILGGGSNVSSSAPAPAPVPEATAEEELGGL